MNFSVSNRNLNIIFFFALFAYLCLAGMLITSFDFNDETEKLITAQLIDSGLLLYKDIFVQHGPVSYMFSHIFYKIYPSHSLAPYRLIPIFLALLSLASIITSPIFTSRRARLIAGILFLFGLAAFQVDYAFVMTMYQAYAGFFFIIALTSFILPFCLELEMKSWRAFVAGTLIAMLFFNSFSFSVAILFCFLLCGLSFFAKSKTSKRVNLIIFFIVGGLFTTSINIVWMFFYADFIGYFVDHIYFNMKFYSTYIAFDAMSFFSPLKYLNPYFLFKNFSFPVFLFDIVSILSLLLFSIAIFQLRPFKSKISYCVVSSILLLLTILYTNPRFTINYASFGSASFVLCGILFIALTTALILEKQDSLSPKLSKAAIITAILFFISGISLQFYKTNLYSVSPISYYLHKGNLGPLDNEEMKFLRSIVPENEKVLQLPFSLNFYVFADRLPASGIFYWMPWMNDYSKNPLKDYPLDLCQQMNESPPKAIHYTDIAIWDNKPDSFMHCFKDLLKQHYYPSEKVTNVWFRNDVEKK